MLLNLEIFTIGVQLDFCLEGTLIIELPQFGFPKAICHWHSDSSKALFAESLVQDDCHGRGWFCDQVVCKIGHFSIHFELILFVKDVHLLTCKVNLLGLG